ncbi:MAG: hypothetical protein E7117_08195 [Bacteroidales bacterium]|nr:hypothetical protein [Bacteroidales bacterium]
MFRCLLKGNIDMNLLLHYIYEAGYSEEDDEIIAENVIPTMVFKFMVGTVSVYIQVDTHLGKSTEFSAEGQIEASAGLKLGTEVSMGVEWSKDAGARAIKDVYPYMTIHHPEFKAEASAEAKVSRSLQRSARPFAYRSLLLLCAILSTETGLFVDRSHHFIVLSMKSRLLMGRN